MSTFSISKPILESRTVPLGLSSRLKPTSALSTIRSKMNEMQKFKSDLLQKESLLTCEKVKVQDLIKVKEDVISKTEKLEFRVGVYEEKRSELKLKMETLKKAASLILPVADLIEKFEEKIGRALKNIDRDYASNSELIKISGDSTEAIKVCYEKCLKILCAAKNYKSSLDIEATNAAEEMKVLDNVKNVVTQDLTCKEHSFEITHSSYQSLMLLLSKLESNYPVQVREFSIMFNDLVAKFEQQSSSANFLFEQYLNDLIFSHSDVRNRLFGELKLAESLDVERLNLEAIISKFIAQKDSLIEQIQNKHQIKNFLENANFLHNSELNVFEKSAQQNADNYSRMTSDFAILNESEVLLQEKLQLSVVNNANTKRNLDQLKVKNDLINNDITAQEFRIEQLSSKLNSAIKVANLSDLNMLDDILEEFKVNFNLKEDMLQPTRILSRIQRLYESLSVQNKTIESKLPLILNDNNSLLKNCEDKTLDSCTIESRMTNLEENNHSLEKIRADMTIITTFDSVLNEENFLCESETKFLSILKQRDIELSETLNGKIRKLDALKHLSNKTKLALPKVPTQPVKFNKPLIETPSILPTETFVLEPSNSKSIVKETNEKSKDAFKLTQSYNIPFRTIERPVKEKSSLRAIRKDLTSSTVCSSFDLFGESVETKSVLKRNLQRNVPQVKNKVQKSNLIAKKIANIHDVYEFT